MRLRQTKNRKQNSLKQSNRADRNVECPQTTGRLEVGRGGVVTSADGGMKDVMMSSGSRYRSARQGSRLTSTVVGWVSKAAQRIWKPMSQKRWQKDQGTQMPSEQQCHLEAQVMLMYTTHLQSKQDTNNK